MKMDYNANTHDSIDNNNDMSPEKTFQRLFEVAQYPMNFDYKSTINESLIGGVKLDQPIKQQNNGSLQQVPLQIFTETQRNEQNNQITSKIEPKIEEFHAGNQNIDTKNNTIHHNNYYNLMLSYLSSYLYVTNLMNNHLFNNKSWV